jgi:alpha-L-arabinofuranosidase
MRPNRGLKRLVVLSTVVCLHTLSLVSQGANSLRVDAGRTGELISPFVYGQFIEHLGRCIYGGLWAEMLEDRKFFFPVTGEAPAWEMFRPGPTSWQGEGHPYELLVRSPWMILGDPSRVTMVSGDSYVGDHTPEIALPGDETPVGIVQERLGLVEGREYTGRVVLSGDPGAAPIEVSLVWGGGANDRQTIVVAELSDEYVKHPLRFTARNGTDNGRLEIVGRGGGRFRIGTVSLMPADNVYGWRADTLALVRELDSPIYRWPGGNFVSGYDWRDGIGDPDRRPPRKNPAWRGIESNDVGIHEFIDLCRELGTEPFIAVNTGLGEVHEAAEQVDYANGSVETPMGRLRAENGRPLPFGVRYWAVGNEMYGDWQLGHMPLEEYVEKHIAVVEAMRAVDPTIRTVAVGEVGEWSRRMLADCADHMELISEHAYWQNREDVVEHVTQVPERIRRIAEAHRTYRREIEGLAARDIRIAFDEWNYWYGPNEYGELGVRYFLQDALGIAAGLHELFRQSDLFYMANYAQTVNVIGAIKTTPVDAGFEPTGLVLKLYRRHFGSIPVEVSLAHNALDAAAAWTEDRSALTVAVVNPTEEPHTLEIDLAGARLAGKGRRWVLTGPDRFAGNRPGKPREVDIRSETLDGIPERLQVDPLSVTLFRLDAGAP